MLSHAASVARNNGVLRLKDHTAASRRLLSEEHKRQREPISILTWWRSRRLIFDLAALSAFADELECIHFHRGLIVDDTRRASWDGTLQAADWERLSPGLGVKNI